MSTTERPLRGLFPYVSKQRKTFVLVILSGIAAAGLPIAAAGVGAHLIGQAVTGSKDLGPTIGWLTSLTIAAAAAAWWQSDVGHDWAFRMLRDLRIAVFDGLERATPGRLLGKRTGDLSATANADVSTTELFFAHAAGDYVGSTLVSIAAVGVLASINVPTAGVTLLLMILVGIIPLVLASRAAKQGRALREELGTLNAEVVDGVQGLRELAVFGQGEAYQQRLTKRTEEIHGHQLRYARRSGTEQAVTELLLGFGAVAILAVASHQTTTGRLDAGNVPLLVVLAVAALVPIAAVSATARTFGDVRAAAARMLTIIGYPRHVPDDGVRVRTNDEKPSVRFDDVHFRYTDDGPDVLKGVTFDLHAGETVALVGKSGAGKSTCVNLLLRFWDPAKGAVSIGRTDLRELTQDSLGSQVAVVSQDVYLFNTTIRDNIRLRDPNATDQQVEQAARLAVAHDFIEELADGYDTRCGERGAQLSGGQRQRIAIARALLADARVIVLDEAVSNLDAESEQALHQAFATIRKTRTMLVVAHRLSTIRGADRVVMLDGGRVVASGPHDWLLTQSAPYRELLAAQALDDHEVGPVT